MIGIIRWFKRFFGPGSMIDRVYRFNQYERDRWVARQAALIPPGSRVLDVGAGTGPYRPLFANCDYQAHDFARLNPAQLRDRQEYGPLDYVSDINSIPVSAGSFDAILCTEVLEHVPEPIKTVYELARILRPGGRLLLTAPLGSGLHQEPFHFYGGYTPFWYHKFLAEAGFDDIRVEPNGGFFRHYGQESWRFAKMLAPWQQPVWFPVWLFSLPWTLSAPLLGAVLDHLDTHRGFTVGYHVTASTKKEGL